MPDDTFKEAKRKARRTVQQIGGTHVDIDKDTLIRELTRLYVIETKYKERLNEHRPSEATEVRLSGSMPG